MTYSPIAPATDAQGNDVWNIWASLPGQPEVIVSTDSLFNCVSVMSFLDSKGYTVVSDAIIEHRTDEQIEAAYEEGYNAPAFDLSSPEFDEIDEMPEEFTAEDHAFVATLNAHRARLATDSDFARGVKDAARDAGSYEHEQAWLTGQRYSL